MIELLEDAGEEPGIVTAELNLQELKEVRRKLPALEHRVFYKVPV